MSSQSFRFWLIDIRFSKKNLPLEVGSFYFVDINKPDEAYASPRKQIGRSISKCPAAYDCNPGFPYFLLPILAYELFLPAIAVFKKFCHTIDTMPKKLKMKAKAAGKKALALISGGFDSPIAAYRMMKEGWDLDFLLYFPEPYVSDREREITVSSIKKVKAKLGLEKKLRLFVVNNGSAINQITEKLSGEIQYVVLRRIMFAAAAELAKREKCTALVTGENLGQVASQTLDNLASISTASPIPVLRPLLCFDKEETIDIAREVGTFDFSKDHSDCSLGAIPKPSTKVKEADAKKAERKVGSKKLISEILKTAKIVEI